MSEAVPVLVAMVVEGAHDVEAAEVLGVLCRDDERAYWIVNALTDELAAPTAETAVRLRLTQALIELPVAAAGEVLLRLTRDSDPAVARLASVFVRVLAASMSARMTLAARIPETRAESRVIARISPTHAPP